MKNKQTKNQHKSHPMQSLYQPLERILKAASEKQHFSNEENFKKKNLLLIVSEEWTSISMKQEQVAGCFF